MGRQNRAKRTNLCDTKKRMRELFHKPGPSCLLPTTWGSRLDPKGMLHMISIFTPTEKASLNPTPPSSKTGPPLVFSSRAGASSVPRRPLLEASSPLPDRCGTAFVAGVSARFRWRTGPDGLDIYGWDGQRMGGADGLSHLQFVEAKSVPCHFPFLLGMESYTLCKIN